MLLYPRSLVLCDSNLIVFNEKMDTMFQCFHLPDLTFQYGFGTQGQGPNDFVLPSITPVKYQKNGFVMLDGINLKHISVEKDKAIVQTSTLNYGFNCFNDLISISDSSYCCNGGFENEKEFRFLYPDGNHESWGEYPETEERFGSVLDRNQAYIKMTVAKPDKSCFVSFYQHIRRFRIYGKDGELKRDVILDILPGQERPEVDDYLRFIHPISVYATDSYIYTLNLDMTTEEIENRKTTPNIQVFDWEGKPLIQYKHLVNNEIEKSTLIKDTSKVYKLLGFKNVDRLVIENNKVKVEGRCKDLDILEDLKSMDNIKNFSITNVEYKNKKYYFNATYEIGGTK